MAINYRSLGFSSYTSYLENSNWKITKQKFFKSKFIRRIDGYAVCSCCLSPNRLNVHHKTYKRLGKEKLTDLVLLCDQCHQKTHDIEKYGKSSLNTAHKKIETIFKEPKIEGKLYAKQRKEFLKNKSAVK